jgi:lipopolysaccharide export system permease protein
VAPDALRRLEVGLYNKLAIPFASLVFALIGAPMGLRRPRSGNAMGLGLSIVLIFAYYIVWNGAGVMGQGGAITPLVASWLANAIGLLSGLALLWRAPT